MGWGVVCVQIASNVIIIINEMVIVSQKTGRVVCDMCV